MLEALGEMNQKPGTVVGVGYEQGYVGRLGGSVN